MDLSGLVVESIEIVPADSLESAAYGHGMRELAASCCEDQFSCGLMPDDSDEV